MNTETIDKEIHNFIINKEAYPTPIGFMHFPKSVCTSVNEVLYYSNSLIYSCHGIPDLRPLEEGDCLNIDITLFKDGVHGDNSVMVQIGEVHPDVRQLIETT